MKTVAIIGASNDRSKYRNKSVRAHLLKGYQVYPINPTSSQIEGIPAFKSISELPIRPQIVSMYVPPNLVQKLLPEIAVKGCDELWLNPGTESDEVIADAKRLGLNVIQACSILAVDIEPDSL